MTPPFHVSARFKRPAFLPGTSVFSLSSQSSKDDYQFEVHDKESGVPQLIGTISRNL